jgi:hypothetical protein
LFLGLDFGPKFGQFLLSAPLAAAALGFYVAVKRVSMTSRDLNEAVHESQLSHERAATMTTASVSQALLAEEYAS